MSESDSQLPAPGPGVDEDNVETNMLMDEQEWRQQLVAVLNEIDHAGEFAVTKPVTTLPPLHPMLTVDGNIRIAYPILDAQARQLCSVAEKAPYGKGHETVLDESVRKAWQIDASKISFHHDSAWAEALSALTREMASAMGLSSSQQSRVVANLYKMLIYETGGHFQKHRDTEKEPGMFGTLILHLPSVYTGGSLVLNHQGETKTVDLAAEGANGFHATAFYADCEHQLLPVTSGWRVCLVYNLVLQQTRQPTPVTESLPTAQELTVQLQLLQELAMQWSAVCSEKIQGYLLEHHYTEANFDFSELKGRDKQVADLLRHATGADGKPLFVTNIALLEKWQAGSPEVEHGYYGGYCDRDDEYGRGHPSMGDVHDSHVKFRYWFDRNELVDSSPLEDVTDNYQSVFLNMESESIEEEFDTEPDENHYEQYMGNYGPTLEYWYYKGALMFWPRYLDPKVAASAGLELLTDKFLTVPLDEAEPYKDEAVKFLKRDNAVLPTGRLLHGVFRTGDDELLEELVTQVLESATPNQLSSCLSSFMSTDGSSPNAQVRKLFEKRAEQLCTATRGGRPTFSWRQPNAKFSGSQATEVNEFLRSNQETQTFYGFSDSIHAKNWARKYFCQLHGYKGDGYHAKANNSGESVTVTKIMAANVQTYDRGMKELNLLTSSFGVPPAAATSEEDDSARSASAAGFAGSASKKRRPGGSHDDAIEID